MPVSSNEVRELYSLFSEYDDLKAKVRRMDKVAPSQEYEAIVQGAPANIRIMLTADQIMHQILFDLEQLRDKIRALGGRPD